VGTWRAWKKEIWDGSIPVGPGGIITSMGAVPPTLAEVSTLLASMTVLRSKTVSLEKMNPTFPVIKFFKESS